MFKDIAKFCDGNEIVCFMASGTLLGAVRHKGFIPWDDDIDIFMDVTNYRKFLKIVDRLPSKYFLQNYKTDRKCSITRSKIRLNGTTSMERYMTNHDIHYGICMDIFIINGISDFKLRRKVQESSARLMSLLLLKYYLLERGFEINAKLKILYKLIPKKIRLALILLLEKMLLMDVSKCSLCYSTYFSNLNEATIYKSSSYYPDNRKKIIFENAMFYVPKNYEEVLTNAYGDWRKLPPEDQRGGHGDIIVDFENDYKMYYTGK